MTYANIIYRYLKDSRETVDKFAKRAHVTHSTVYRAINGENIRFDAVVRMVKAAGGSVVISWTRENRP